jgi:thiol-disulfide isomerase/thioredoxin
MGQFAIAQAPAPDSTQDSSAITGVSSNLADSARQAGALENAAAAADSLRTILWKGTGTVLEVGAGAFEIEPKTNKLVLKEKGPAVVEFRADWCPPCKRMEKEGTMIDVAEAHQDSVQVFSFPVRDLKSGGTKEDPATAGVFARAYPTLVFFYDGQPQKNPLMGYATSETVNKWVELNVQNIRQQESGGK